ncbi:hypothetical protein Tco_1390335 [Tanacetum coccineum]
MEEYIKLEEEKARRRGKVYNWETAMYGKIRYDEDVHDLGSVETKFPAIVFNNMLTSEATLSCEPTVSSLNRDEIDFRISFDESDDEDYTSICLRFHHPSLRFLTEPTVNPEHIDEFNLIDETSLSECDEEEQKVLNFNDLFSFNVIYPSDSKSDKDNDDDKVDIEHSSGDLSVKPLPDVINTDDGVYAHGTVYTAYSLNEYSVYDTSINTAYPGDLVKEILTNIGGEFIKLKIVKCWSFETSRRLFNTILLITQHGESTEQISGEFLILILFNSRI